MSVSWYEQEPEGVLAALDAHEDGLSVREAARRLKEDGLNALPDAPVDGVFTIFLRQFQSPLIYVLLVASAAIFFVGEIADGIIVLVVLIFNAIVGTVQEGRAQNTLRALSRYVETNATVVRGGEEMVIPDREVVRGDILALREGEKIPADARLLSVRNLKVDEAAFTGESEPAAKTAELVHGKALPAAEQHNMVFKSANVLAGNGRAVVVATGSRTLIGSIAKQIAAIDTEMPLKADIARLSRFIIIITSIIAATVFVLGIMHGQGFVVMFATIVSLAVSIIPEGLPIVITLVLATGVWRMSKRNALVKRLQAVEALGQAQVIAVDKTGTLTKNEMVVREVWTAYETFQVSGVGYDPSGTIESQGAAAAPATHPALALAARLAAQSADARVFFSESETQWRIAGDPTEAALRVFGEKAGFKKDDLLRETPLIAELPFDYHDKFHAAVFDTGNGNLLVVSGAPEAILARSTRMMREGASLPIRRADREALEETFAEMSGKGLRVVALASRTRFSENLESDGVHGLTFVALFGMQDALRPEVADAMARALAADIRIVMITGDHERTARAIAKEAGIWKEGDEVLTGADIDEMLDPELAVRVAGVSVFARVTPEHKLRIVKAYENRKQIIAMTGDGVNDAPSLVAADLGVAMGGIGTEVAKEAADIVLLDDNFGTIVSAIEEGRSIYKTIKKVILYLFSTSLGEALTIIGALILGMPLPLLAAQIIWLNFVTDGFLDVSLAMEPKERGLLSGSFGQAQKRLVDRFMIGRMIVMALPMMIGTLFLFSHYASTDLERAWTVSLTTLAVFQWLNAWNCRSETESIFSRGFLSNKFLLAATGIVVVLQLLAVYTPFLQRLLRTVPLGVGEWAAIAVIAISVVLVEEVRKFLYRHYGSVVRARRSSAS